MKISIVVPVYNTECFLQECLESIKKQTHADFECILVDDGSTDRSGSICDAYVQNDNRFRVLHKLNGGLVSARKAGVSIARSQYICFVDSDDYISESYLSDYSSIIEQCFPDMIANNYIETVSNGVVLPTFLDEYNGLYEGERLDVLREKLLFDKNVRDFNMGVVFPSLCLKCIKRKLLMQQYMHCDEGIRMGEDLMISLPLAMMCKSIYLVNFQGYFYRKNANSIVNTFEPQCFECLDRLTNYLETWMSTHRIQISYYFLQRIYALVITAGLSLPSRKEFVSFMKEKITKEKINKSKMIKITKFPLKKKIIIFLFCKKMWTILYWIISLFNKKGY